MKISDNWINTFCCTLLKVKKKKNKEEKKDWEHIDVERNVFVSVRRDDVLVRISNTSRCTLEPRDFAYFVRKISSQVLHKSATKCQAYDPRKLCLYNNTFPPCFCMYTHERISIQRGCAKEEKKEKENPVIQSCVVLCTFSHLDFTP